MKISAVIYTHDPETVWNALRFANFARAMGEEVTIFLIGKGVELSSLNTETFKVTEELEAFIDDGGEVFVCGTCLQIHQIEAPEAFTVATLNDLYAIVKDSDRIITF